MSNPLIPTKSAKVWFTLVSRYVNAHTLNGKTISIERAQEDLFNLYREFNNILGPYASDSAVLYKIHTTIMEYENDAFTSLARLDISDCEKLMAHKN
jgi:hypothetical protein